MRSKGFSCCRFPSRPTGRAGFSLLELLVGVVIFAFALTPFLHYGSRQTQQAYSVGKHVLAGQLAASLLDHHLSYPFAECRQRIGGFPETPPRIIDDADFMVAMTAGASGSAAGEASAEGTPVVDFSSLKLEHDVFGSLQEFTYVVTLREPTLAEEKDRVFLVRVAVQWFLQPGRPDTRQEVAFAALKFREGGGP